MDVLIICVLVLTVLLYCFVYVHLFLCVLSVLVYGLLPPSGNSSAVNNNNNNVQPLCGAMHIRLQHVIRLILCTLPVVIYGCATLYRTVHYFKCMFHRAR